MDEEQQGSPDESVTPRSRARDLLRRTAPVLRDVNARIDEHAALREARDAIVDRAGDVVQKADEQLRKITAIEGTVVERPGDDPMPAATASPPAEATGATEHTDREPHWTKQRLARMATAAATEAVRPHRPLVRRETKLALLVGAVLGVFVAVVLRRR